VPFAVSEQSHRVSGFVSLGTLRPNTGSSLLTGVRTSQGNLYLRDTMTSGVTHLRTLLEPLSRKIKHQPNPQRVS